MGKTISTGRLQKIDIAKGMACLLMIAAHLQAGRILAFGTFAASLFFACSGMNTILLIKKTKGNACYGLFHLLFPLLLFFGGSTQLVIAMGGRLRIDPGFLQCIALSVAIIFFLSKAFRDPLHVGYLFPVPFLAQQLLPLSFLAAFQGTPLAFVFGNGFALFPWLGFFLFGAFLLNRGQRVFPWLPAFLACAFALSYWIAGIPMHKFWMSSSYILFSLLAVTLVFALSGWVARNTSTALCRALAEFFALPGRNALMFLYLHYFVLRFFASADFFPSLHLYLLFATLYLFGACWVLLLSYEKVKRETALLFPFLALALVLAALRWGGLLRGHGGLPVVDLVVGVLFAFVYVLLRRKFAARCERKMAAAAATASPAAP